MPNPRWDPNTEYHRIVEQVDLLLAKVPCRVLRYSGELCQNTEWLLGTTAGSLTITAYPASVVDDALFLYLRLRDVELANAVLNEQPPDFNAWSGKWNIVVSGGSFEQRLSALMQQLRARLDRVGVQNLSD